MDTKDTRQTYKQYKERQKRIAIKKSYDDKLEQSSNKIEDLYVQLEQIKAALNNQIETRQQIRNEMHREMLRQYNKDNTIEETIELAEKTTCSRDSIGEIQNACSTGINVSTVDLDTIDKLIDIEQDICNEIPHTNFISDLLIRRGGHTKFPSEKNDVNEEDDANGT